jgi:hypothetical protein
MSRLALTSFFHGLGSSAPTGSPSSPTKLPNPAPAVAPPSAAGAVVMTVPGPKGERREVTKAYLIDAAQHANCNRTRDVLSLGKLASLWIATQTDAYQAEGLRGDLLNVNRQIAAYWLSDLMGRDLVKVLGISTVYALLPLVKRDSRTGVWTIRPGVEREAMELVAMASANRWNAHQAKEALAMLFPPRVKRQGKKGLHAKKVKRLQREIQKLAPDEFAELQDWLKTARPASSGRTSAAA